MKKSEIVFINRYTGEREREAVYGEWALRLCYGTALGRLATHLLIARSWVSRLYGWWMKRPRSTAKIRPFVERFGINADEFARPLEAYSSFNDFFSRQLKAGSRPVAGDASTVVFPADGRHFGWERLGEERGIFIKGQRWDLAQLLGDAELARSFAGGTLVLSRLCPVDYHHFHYPCGGKVAWRRSLKGRLYSVNPLALRIRMAYFWENQRVVECLESDRGCAVCLVDVGATNVGSIGYVGEAGVSVERGDRRGWFEFGGSSVVTLFPKGTVRLSNDLKAATAEGYELYARAGDSMGEWID